MKNVLTVILLCAVILAGCSKDKPKSPEPEPPEKIEGPDPKREIKQPEKKEEAKMPADLTFGRDVEFMKKYVEVIVLSDDQNKAQVAVVPAYQGRVMTSTADGADGFSYGWINYGHVASGEIVPHINVYGGEDRFWMGPEGGQYAIFFSKGARFVLDDWQTPAVIDTEAYDVVSQDKTTAVFKKSAKLKNYSDTEFDIEIMRRIKLLSATEAASALNTDVPDSIKMVAFESLNIIANKGAEAWTKDKGLLSIWILGMFKHSPTTTVVIPFKPGEEVLFGPKVNDEYFGKVPPNRLVVKEDVLFFSGDGQYRSKIGIPPKRVKPIMGSYDAANGVLTLAQFTVHEGVTDYVNSMWEVQEKPYAGDVANSYNDGPAEPGAKPLGPFYELESSSPAAALAPNDTIAHIHRTFHLKGTEAELNTIAKLTLGVSIEEIKNALPK